MTASDIRGTIVQLREKSLLWRTKVDFVCEGGTLVRDISKKKKMSDIARLAGVSESTVSRALADSPLINAKTKARIRAIAAEQHYAINRQAQNLRLQSSRTISVVIPVDHEPRQHVSDPFFLELIGAIADALTEAEYDVLLSRVHRESWRAKVMSQNYVDGVVIIGQSDLHQDIDEFSRQTDIPMVVWGAKLAGQNYVSVGTDNRKGGSLASEYLLERGHKRILFLGDCQLPEVGLRYQGYCDAHEATGVAVSADLCIPCSFVRESAEQAMHKVLDTKLDFDAIFAASDILASEVIKQLWATNSRTMRSIPVVGFDDISMASHMAPALTTVSQNIYVAGASLVDNLLRQIKGEPVVSEVIQPKLKIRSSA
ncbi:LacI family DNA-binding transcriptional regulator [Gilvimarinus sp. SDUM040013]|uniref:LacI family DNA-binding transcriptional regulator n=1 Tax=Gilvimarinus gilvus TaxID=3058038 RepID=A0ABU4S1X2_9GAMM|nr:LacI family DNA-binding transcriptional regulator [Gilvimarinus sp. SDUM040013]MDO3386187.1 LacI family DNA-binding transcriptional regulator [Gilvimarinus sp. SDUM040013]MDX6849818.1 LacI family DNA-binding transcriptional regulator [Gilvimarinus sp. SDUM040013]